MSVPFRLPSTLSLLAIGLLLASCGNSQAPVPAEPPPPEVAVETVKAMPLEVTTKLPGRVVAVRTAEIRARVEGVVGRRNFMEGSEVKAGDKLFEIDPSRLNAEVLVAEAAVAKAEADLAQASLKAERYASLAQTKSVSKQDYDEAKATAKQAEAALASAKASLTRAKLDLSYADVRAPINGHIGRALVTEGALVGKDSPTHLATIEQIDTVYVDFYESGPELLRVRKKFKFGEKAGVQDPNINIVLPDKSLYPLKGKLLFTESAVDPATEAVLMRAEVPNPDHLMLPGMVVLVYAEQGAIEQAFTVPQRAVTRNQRGASVMVLGQDGIVQAVPIETDFAQGDRWVVSKGLKGGEQVIIEGLQKVHPGKPAHIAQPMPSAPAVK